MDRAEPHLLVVSSNAVSSEQGRDARAKAWSYIFGCYQPGKEAITLSLSHPNDAERRPDETGATAITQRTA